MIYDLDTMQGTDTISLGNQGENNARTLEFDVSPWLAEYPDATIRIMYKRPDDVRIYPVPISKISVRDGILRWLIDRNLTVYAGHGYAVISCVQDQVERRGVRIVTFVRPGFQPSGPVPDAIEDYVQELSELSESMRQVFLSAQESQASAQPADTIPNVYIYADNLTGFVDKKDERMGRVEYRSRNLSFSAAVKIKPQGTSSMAYPKKNFTITLYESESYETKKKQIVKAAWGAQSKYVLKADWIDPTLSSNVVSARLAGQMNAPYGIYPAAANAGCVDGFPVLLHLNDDVVGLYNFTIPKDGWMCGFKDDSVAMILACEVQTGAGSFREEADFDSWSSEYGQEDDAALEAFNRMLRFVRDASDDDFRSHANEYLNLDATINYFIFCYLSGAIDNLGKNMLMTTSDRIIWTPILYDMDSLWGVSYDGIQTIDFDHACPGWYQCYDSLLWEKLMRCFPNEIAARYAQLRSGALSTGTITAAFEDYVYGIPQRLYDLNLQRWPDINSMVRTLDRMRSWIYARAQYTDFMIRNLVSMPSGDYGRILYDLPDPWTSTGDGTVIVTSVRLFDNPLRDWTLVLRLSNDLITSGDMTILSCIDSELNGLHIKREYTDSNQLYISMGAKQVIRCPAAENLPLSVFVVVKARNNYYVYRDGAYIADINRSAMPSAWSGPMYLGGSGNALGTETWWGTTPMVIQGVTVYQRAMTGADAMAISAPLSPDGNGGI